MLQDNLRKIPKSEAIVLAKYGTDVYQKLNSDAEPGCYFIIGSEPHTRRSSPKNGERITLTDNLVLRPKEQHHMPKPGSMLARAVNLTIKIFTLTTVSMSRGALTNYLMKEMSLPRTQIRSQVSEMLHRYRILMKAD